MATLQNTKPLSSRTVEVMKPGDKIKADTGENTGLRVKCGATGVKTFFYRYTSPITSKLVQVKIGHFPETSLAEARLKLHELKQIRRQGRCPRTEAREQQQQEKEQEKARVEPVEKLFTVKDLVELYLTQYIEDRKSPNGRIIAGARKPKGQSETRRTLYGDAIPKLGEMPANAVTRKAVVDMIMAIVQRGANVQAGNVLRELSAAYEFAIGLGYFSDEFANPAILAKASLRQAKVKLTHQRGKRVLSDTELATLLKWLPGSDYTATQKNVLRFTLWTGCRTGEVCNAAWKDIDLKKRTFHIRESKTEVERYVQLPSQAVEFLKTLRLTTGDYPFPSQKTRLPIQQKQLTEQAWRMRVSNKMVDLPAWTPHDLRRSVRTGLSRLQCTNEVAEAVLGHSRKGIEGTYDLHRYEAECRQWLQKWADHLDALIRD
ncbi:MAG: tyrosine-type recombinase/integrase [Candidatus Thiodiazotropha sp. (ex Ctena orbiculata)]|jgi:integrase|nr:tyrosine-type recombinase/integrase [Candidatus Thiodiazotropha taylori]MBT2996122.1 tyrosine-type recombinase/integrase [Candidatus Thiodiazotropha taylori]MBT2999734.1 tyrosine-type recombinase/integrase [Candidatus Thiodiazotropha taylori]MBV2106377.1 tyrosine-type recombinase/integrase [Candidatus Thiodiazotropha taylori]MBV2110509.1 tyrosine-type recombinase/integrase [Candidatus Thiodiazotropha taylori]